LREPTAPKGARVRPRTANRARRPKVAPRDTRAGRAAVVPAGVVGVATGAPGCGRALPGHAADAPRSAGATRRGAMRPDHAALRPRRPDLERRRLGAAPPTPSSAEAVDWSPLP